MTFADALLILFIGLKLTGYIDWSWWLVFSPLIVKFVIYFIVEYAKRNRGIR